MSYGFRFLGYGSAPSFSSADIAVALIDVFEVSPSSSGSRTYPKAGALQFFIVQTGVEPAVVNVASASAFSSVVATAVTVGADKSVSWSPGVVLGAPQNVLIYVFGA